MDDDIDVRVVDVTDDAQLRAWWEVYHAAEAERLLDTRTPWETARTSYRHVGEDEDVVMLAAWRHSTVVGAARAQLPRRDNVHLAFVSCYVHPDHRRAGIGTALLADLERHGAAAGRTVYLSSVHTAPGATTDSLRFAEARGYPRVSMDEIKVLDLEANADRLASLVASAAERAGGYELLAWTDPMPAELTAGMAALYTRFLDEIPLGGIDVVAQQWDEARIRRVEDRRAASGHTHLTVAARAPDGSLAGYTDVAIRDVTAHQASVEATLVLPEHRGHGLGLAVKVRLQQVLAEQFPRCREVVTGNAGVNTHMNAVNDLLGYRVVEHCVDVQKTVPG